MKKVIFSSKHLLPIVNSDMETVGHIPSKDYIQFIAKSPSLDKAKVDKFLTKHLKSNKP